MTTSRRCHDCGATNLADADYCAACGVAIDTAGIERPWLAALADGDDTIAANPSDATVPPSPSDATVAADLADDTIPAVPAGPPNHTVPSRPTSPPSTFDSTQPMGDTALPVASPPQRDRPWLAPTIAVFVVIALAATLLALLLGTRSDSEQPTATDTATNTVPATATGTAPDTSDPTAPTSSDAPATTAAPTVPPTSATPVTVDPAAAAELASIADADLDRVLSLQGRWVPQLSAKEDGTEWEGVVYDLPAIVDLHEQLTAQVGDTLLVEGSTLAFLIDGQRMAEWWITLANVDFDDADGALAWCADAGFDRANCAARLLTDDDTATGTLRLRDA